MPELESLLASWVNITFPVTIRLDELIEKSEEEVKSFLLEKSNRVHTEAKEKARESRSITELERYVVG
jgi:hypothetical protein